MTVVIVLSGKARSGKGSVVQLAQILLQKGDEEREVRAVSFASALKRMAVELVTDTGTRDYFELGLPYKRAYALWELGETLTSRDIRKKTPGGRRFLQELGTTMRSIDDLYWIKIAAEKIVALPSDTQIVFVPDGRFTNEADYIRGMFVGLVWRIERYNADGSPYDNGLTPEAKNHVSETQLDDYRFDAVLIGGDMAVLFEEVKRELKRLGFE